MHVVALRFFILWKSLRCRRVSIGPAAAARDFVTHCVLAYVIHLPQLLPIARRAAVDNVPLAARRTLIRHDHVARAARGLRAPVRRAFRVRVGGRLEAAPPR
jgi:hypothetical protein